MSPAPIVQSTDQHHDKPRHARGILIAIPISLALWGLIYLGVTHARPAEQPTPLKAPAELLKARAECPVDQPLKCRAALTRAYAAVSWNRKQRLDRRTLAASNLTPIEVGRALALRAGWGQHQWVCLATLWSRESGWIPTKLNYAGSGAYGIPQALPASKMRSAGADWRTNPATQIRWGISYIKSRYGDACGALEHSNTRGYY